MSGLDSWEDDESVRDEGLSRQTQQSLNLNSQNSQAQTFTPNANTFQPGAQSFQPGQSFQPSQQYQQYGGYNQPQHNQYYNQQQQQQQQQQYGGGYSQYGQQNYNQYNQGYGAQQDHNYNQAYNAQYGTYDQPQSYTQQSQPRQTPVIAKRPLGKDASSSSASAPAAPSAEAAPASAAPPKAKVLSITGDTPAPKAKVLSIGATAPAKKEVPSAEDGAKATALKAIEKSEKPAAALNNKSSPTPNSGKSSPTPAEARAVREAEAVAKEQAADVDEEILEEVYGKEHVNLVTSYNLQLLISSLNMDDRYSLVM